jgi:hypothetical protein
MLAAAVVIHRYDSVGAKKQPYWCATWMTIHMGQGISGTAAASQAGALRKLADKLDEAADHQELLSAIDATP